MINRVLIRMKVVQMLYSYLLTEKQFKLAEMPEVLTKEKRFAHAVYLDLLLLMVRTADNLEMRGGHTPLADTRFIKTLKADERIKSLSRRYPGQTFGLESLSEQYAEAIKESALFKNFQKDKGQQSTEDQVWENIFTSYMANDPRLANRITGYENYTLAGYERAKELVNETFREFYTSRDNAEDAERSLRRSLDKSRDLYFMLVTLPVALARLRERQLDENRYKYLPTNEDLNPNLRFVNNRMVEAIAGNEKVKEFEEDRKFNWLADDREFVESLLARIMQSDLYAEYMDFPASDLASDAEFWRNVFKQIILNDVDFLEFLEEKSVFWNDDTDIIGTFVLKTFKRFGEGKDGILPQYKDNEDRMFGERLLGDVIRNKDTYRGMINDALNTKSWDTERIAFMDVIICMTAIAEILNFPNIPLTVSLNEYIEIAKSYSTAKSGGFVHGVLAGVVSRLKEAGKLVK